jgi:hypothetical protein
LIEIPSIALRNHQMFKQTVLKFQGALGLLGFGPKGH